ncbi:hypothetical protein L1887_10293 [Cichorium endivia]|nr:hypothetical protein L1887_10293 [Cichorium endivia]
MRALIVSRHSNTVGVSPSCGGTGRMSWVVLRHDISGLPLTPSYPSQQCEGKSQIDAQEAILKHIEMGDALGYKMKGCKKELEALIMRVGEDKVDL